MKTQVKALKLLMDTNNSIMKTYKANSARLKDIDDFSKYGLEDMEKYIIEPFKKILGILKIKIKNTIEFIPIYKDYLKDIKGLSMYDAADLIILIDDIDKFYGRREFLAYCGFTPVVVCGNVVSKMKKGMDYSKCDVVGDEKSKISTVSYNERLKKHIIRIIDKLIQYNDEYQDMYNDIWAKERIKAPKLSKKHITYRTKRKLCIIFLKEYRRKSKAISKSMKEK